MLMAIPAATLTPPDDVSADGVAAAPPSPPPPFAVDLVLAFERSPEIWLSTPLPAPPPLLDASGAPAADATADVVDVDAVEAEMVRVPPAVMSRAVQASASWFAMLRASAMPIEASPPSVSPCADVVADACCVAVIETLPVRLAG